MSMDEGHALAVQARLRERLQGTNIHAQTFLATDYLNHFNEVVMLLDMVPDMPEVLEDARGWHPLSYQDHFHASGFSDRELAIEAYEHAPPRFRRPFDRTVEQINNVVAQMLGQAEAGLMRGIGPDELRMELSPYQSLLRRLIETASGIIHGSEVVLDQAEIDVLLGSEGPSASPSRQDEIDALFK